MRWVLCLLATARLFAGYDELAIDTHLKQYQNQNGGLRYEGHCDRPQAEYFFNLLEKHPEVKLVAEIGFNAGHSSEVFLSARDDIVVVSFDIGQHASVPVAKAYIDERFPGRHELVLGNSKQSVLKFHRDFPEMKFDMIFIDGGHHFDVAWADVKNMANLAHENTIVVMDDLVPEFGHGVGPTKAWNQAKRQGLVTEDLFINPSNTHKKWAQGRYNL